MASTPKYEYNLLKITLLYPALAAVVPFPRYPGRARDTWVFMAPSVSRPRPGVLHPHAVRQRLEDGVHVTAGLRAEAAGVAAALVQGEGRLYLRPGLFAAALRSQVVSGDICRFVFERRRVLCRFHC